MSYYVHNKVIRLPFPKSLLDKCNTDDVYDCEDYLKEKLGDLYSFSRKKRFEITYTMSDTYYLDWVYYSTHGEESGDYGKSRKLTELEMKTIKPYFDKLEVEYDPDDLRLVDYCYYNGCEPPDYYESDAIDESGELL